MALQNIRDTTDITVCIGDLVDYGPCPAECIDWVKKHAAITVRGNHDHSVSYDADPKCSPRYREMALATKKLHQRLISSEDIAFLKDIPTDLYFRFGGVQFYAVHASPTDPLYHYIPYDISDDDLARELSPIHADVILMGHTHMPFIRQIKGKLVVNPGSVGQPKDGDTRASSAVWEDGYVSLLRQEYSVEETIRQLEKSFLDRQIVDDLTVILRYGKM
jgi:putative phosphoesterase